jgi:hypothetical protein
MNHQTMESKRAGARAFGLIFQALAFLVVLGTCIAADIVAHLGATVGVNSNQDPFVWTILAAGLFAACVLAGFGYVLGMLCAIYDRQNPETPLKAPSNDRSALSPRPPKVESPPPTPPPPPPPPLKETATWEFLTRPRHVRKPK